MARKQKTWAIGRSVRYQCFVFGSSKPVHSDGKITELQKSGRYVIDDKFVVEPREIKRYIDNPNKRPRQKMSLFEWAIFCAIRAEPQYRFSGEEMRAAKRMAKKCWLKAGKIDRTFETTKIGETVVTPPRHK
jgi:hypothetical protein